jgi:Mrp family chromosome partitioning ATPase
VDGRFGLSTILKDEMPWRSVLRATTVPALTIIPRGPVTNQSSELLLVPRFDVLLQEWKSIYDLVLFNTSPILATDDTGSIAPNFDGVLMVVRAQYTSARLVRNSLDALYQRQVNVLGLILNSVDTEMPDYYYYRYPKYYTA